MSTNECKIKQKDLFWPKSIKSSVINFNYLERLVQERFKQDMTYYMFILLNFY